MRLNVDFSGIADALKSIGGQKAQIGSIRNSTQTKNPIELEIIRKGNVILTKDEMIKHLSCSAGLLTVGNTQITLHIYDTFSDIETLSENMAACPKFHITECQTIENMLVRGRFNRYVPSKRLDGFFLVRPYDRHTQVRGDEMLARLLPCKNCLKTLNYNGFAEHANSALKDKIVTDFSVETFFEDNKSIFRCLPLYTPETFPEGNYTNDWARISQKTRCKANWHCSCCNVCCVEQTGLLHVHHRDGHRGNNRPSNLEVLCLACHKSRPLHERMKYRPDFPEEKRKLEQLRISQKLSRHCDDCNI